MLFAALDLDCRIEHAISDMGFDTPTPIQEYAIPIALDGSDLLATAPTGTGKTIAFCAPSIQHILDKDEKSTTAPNVMILAPSRELARQIYNVVEQLTTHTSIQSQLIIGGTPYGMQQRTLSKPCDILVATPGRVVELDAKQWLDLSDVLYFVIDEADRMLEMGFSNAINHLVKKLPEKHQTLMFSATLEGEKMERFASVLLNNDTQQLRLGASARSVPSQIRQIAYRVDDETHKEAILRHLLTQTHVQQALVFVSNREHVDVWSQRIRKMNMMCDGLHGEMQQGDRSEHMKQMKRGRLQVLVATDVASRGIDLPEINTVINLRLPRKADSYINRAGRASREGESGDCISLIDINDLPMIEKIQRYMQTNIKFSRIEGLEAKTKVRAPSSRSRKQKAQSKTKSKK